MPRIAGVDIPMEKNIWVALTYIKGIGKSSAFKVLKEAKIDPARRVKDLAEEEVAKIREIVEKNYLVEGALAQEISLNIKRLKEAGSYRGLRHLRGLPVRGQRTRTNARTRKGKRKTVAGLSQKPIEKT